MNHDIPERDRAGLREFGLVAGSIYLHVVLSLVEVVSTPWKASGEEDYVSWLTILRLFQQSSSANP